MNMMKYTQILYPLALMAMGLIMLNGCSVIDIDYTVPTQSFAAPETTGGKLAKNHKRARVQLHAGTAYHINVAEAHDAAYLVDLTPGKVHLDEGIKYRTAMGSTAELALLKSVDLSAKKILDSLWSFGAKWQFIGATDQGPKRGIKASLSLYYGLGGELKSDKFKSGFRAGREYRSHMVMHGHESILHLGYRINERWLPYLNIRYAGVAAKGKLLSNQFTDYHFSQDVENMGAFAGLQRDARSHKYYYLLEAGHSKIRLKGESLHKRDDFRAGLSVGLNFF